MTSWCLEMGKIIAVVGTTGVGKTALVRALCKQGPFNSGLEQHKERPFQRVFKANPNFALPNQMDYLLLRAEQEHLLRQSAQTGLLDGGLDLDYHGFTHLFHSRAWLTNAEFKLCKRFYELIRAYLPPPDLIINLTASPEIILRRLANRKRINLADPEDILKLAAFLDIWLSTISPDHLIQLDVSENDFGYQRLLPSLLRELRPYYN
jgi:deoxyadenosine/deoxycytidine kinase